MHAGYQLDPQQALPYNNRGFAEYKRHRVLDQAVADYRKAIAISPDLALAHSNLGLVLADKGSLDEAVSECNAALRLSRTWPWRTTTGASRDTSRATLTRRSRIFPKRFGRSEGCPGLRQSRHGLGR